MSFCIGRLSIPASFFLVAQSILACPLLFAATHIIVDPGHGGHDRGARFRHLNEADVVLKISKLLVEEINRMPNLKASLTRSRDQFLQLKERVEISKEKAGDIFLSIHANAVEESASDNHGKGAEFYFLSSAEVEPEDLMNLSDHHFEDLQPESDFVGSNGKSEIEAIKSDLVRQLNIQESANLAKSLDKNWLGSKRKPEHAIRQAPFYVLRKSPIPAVLVEVGFIDNPSEAAQLSTTTFQRRIAQGIAEALKTHLK